jgi:glycosidase
MWGADDSDDRKPMMWPDMVYEPEKSHPLGKPRPEDPVAFDQDLFNYYKAFTSIRRENSAIRRGDYQYVEVSPSPEVFAFIRSDGAQSILCIFNRSFAAQEVNLPAGFVQNKFFYGEANLAPLSEHKFSMTGKSVAVLATNSK